MFLESTASTTWGKYSENWNGGNKLKSAIWKFTTWKKYNTKKVQNEKSSTWKTCHTRKVQKRVNIGKEDKNSTLQWQKDNTKSIDGLLLKFTWRYTNVDLKISPYIVIAIKVISWKFRILNPKNSWVIHPQRLGKVCLQTYRNNRIL